MLTNIRLWPSFALLILTLSPAAAAEKFECPNPFTPNTPAKLEQVKGLLPNVNAMTDVGLLNVAIGLCGGTVCQSSPIIDHLIGVYCPMIARDAALTDPEKATLVQRFSGQVTRQVYSLESGLDIIINVPLAPDIVDAVNNRAKSKALRTCLDCHDNRQCTPATERRTTSLNPRRA